MIYVSKYGKYYGHNFIVTFQIWLKCIKNICVSLYEMNTKEASMWVLIGGDDESWVICVRVCVERERQRDGQRKK